MSDRHCDIEQQLLQSRVYLSVSQLKLIGRDTKCHCSHYKCSVAESGRGMANEMAQTKGVPSTTDTLESNIALRYLGYLKSY